MKLLTKTTLYYITVSLFIFFIGGIGIYQLVKRLENRKVIEELTDQMHRFAYDLKRINGDMENATLITGGLIQMEHVHDISGPKVQFADTLIFDNIRDRFAPFKKLTFYIRVDGLIYKTTIFKSLIESNYLIEQVALIVTIIVIVFLMAVYFLYRYFFGRIWSDFFDTINKIQHFDLSSPVQLSFPQSMIIEFNELNLVLKKMIDRISADFQGLKDFSGNLTHEVQTPLAVIKSKADLMIQDPDITENQMKLAGEISNETLRISRLIKALSLFTKLDHNQYHDIEPIDLEQIIRAKLDVFEDFVEAREINIQFEIKNKPKVSMNPELADILFTNLIKNAIRHNVQNGTIEISCDTGTFLIKNTGKNIDFDPELLFERFSKVSKSSESLGIGLAIVKKICQYYDYTIKYEHNDGFHSMRLNFN